MKTISKKAAEDQFGVLIDQVASESVLIEEAGRPVAVVLSMEEFLCYEQLKEDAMQRDLEVGMDRQSAAYAFERDETCHMIDAFGINIPGEGNV
ncbi:type II toxin-antitoxin system Phd/YefM family antitoxin [Magnetococcales bacterium HHB-1]